MKNCHVCNQLCEDNAELCPICGAFFGEEAGDTQAAKTVEPVLLATFEDLITADIFKDVLTDNRIPYFDSEADSMRVVFGGGFASVELYVDETDFDKAKELYDEFMANEPEFFDESFTEEN